MREFRGILILCHSLEIQVFDLFLHTGKLSQIDPRVRNAAYSFLVCPNVINGSRIEKVIQRIKRPQAKPTNYQQSLPRCYALT